MDYFKKFKNSGDLYLPPRLKRVLDYYIIGNKQSLFSINVWSFVHILSGFLVYNFITTNLLYAFIIHTIWELWQLLITNTPYTIVGLIDTIVDTLLFLIPFMILKKMNKKPFFQIIKQNKVKYGKSISSV